MVSPRQLDEVTSAELPVPGILSGYFYRFPDSKRVALRECFRDWVTVQREDWPDSRRMPGVEVLCRDFNANLPAVLRFSTTPLYQAFNDLVSEGVLTKRCGSGYVALKTPEHAQKILRGKGSVEQAVSHVKRYMAAQELHYVFNRSSLMSEISGLTRTMYADSVNALLSVNAIKPVKHARGRFVAYELIDKTSLPLLDAAEKQALLNHADLPEPADSKLVRQISPEMLRAAFIEIEGVHAKTYSGLKDKLGVSTRAIWELNGTVADTRRQIRNGKNG